CEDDVIVRDDPVRWILDVCGQCVRSRSNNALVPVIGHAKSARGEITDGVARVALEHTGSNGVALGDRGEEIFGGSLCLEQSATAQLFVDHPCLLSWPSFAERADATNHSAE